MVKIQNPKQGQYSITIPLGIVKLKRWKKGTELFLTLSERGDVVLREINAEQVTVQK
ncbi:hypothetical protein KY363_04915 [Candidatus Woesearchaeota archaeon]|nr:hypothetical protein [Candidatus Woesearchaeota archaeon]